MTDEGDATPREDLVLLRAFEPVVRLTQGARVATKRVAVLD